MSEVYAYRISNGALPKATKAKYGGRNVRSCREGDLW